MEDADDKHDPIDFWVRKDGDLEFEDLDFKSSNMNFGVA